MKDVHDNQFEIVESCDAGDFMKMISDLKNLITEDDSSGDDSVEDHEK